jgi:hypothetical protein
MKYLLIICSDEAAGAKLKPKDQQGMMAEYARFTDAVREAGVYKGGEALHPTSAATTVQVRNGQTLTTDGPFAETKEQIGGFYLLDCKNLDEAIEWAAKIPHASLGSVEIRPVVDFSQAANA